MVDTRVRAAQEEDLQDILRLWNLARSPAASAEADRTAVAGLLAHDPGALLVAEQAGSIVGTVVAAWDGWRGHIYRLAVLPDRRRQGIGARLVDAGHERLRARGACRVNAAVGEGDPDLAAFWLAVGYDRDPGIARFAKAL